MTINRMLVALALALPSSHAGAASLAPAGVAACSNCHPRSAGGEPVLAPLAGRSANEIVGAMDAFRSGKRPATVMDRIAKGFTADETAAIAAWYAAQK